MLEFVYILCVGLIIGFLIFIHELGHFLVAKKVGIRVEAFSLGFGPKVWGFQRGETMYKLSLVPLGGYVKMAGEMPGEAGRGDGRDFGDKTITQRAWVVSAGVIMNIVFAFIAFPLAFSLGVPFDAPKVGNVQSEGAAWAAGVLPGDEVLRIDDTEILSFNDIMGEVAHSADAKTFVLRRDGRTVERQVSPRYDDVSGMHIVGVTRALDRPQLKEDVAKKFGVAADHEIIRIDGIPYDYGIDHAASTLEAIVLTIATDDGLREITLEPDMVEPPAAAWRLGVAFESLEVKEVLTAGSGSLAEQAVAANIGIRSGDMITAIGGKPVAIRGDVAREVASLTDGGQLIVTVNRPGKGTVELGPRTVTTAEIDAFVQSFTTSRKGTRVSVMPGSPAARAGMLTGDAFVSIDGKDLTTSKDAVTVIKESVESSEGKPLAVTLQRGEETVALTITPEKARTNAALANARRTPRPLQTIVQIPFPKSIAEGARQAVHQAKSILMTFKSLFSGGISTKNLRGIVTIAYVSYKFTEQGLPKVLFFMGILSLNLAILNILPIPVLDGGHLVFLILEKIKGDPLSERAMGWANMGGLVFILGLMVFVTFNDVMSFFF